MAESPHYVNCRCQHCDGHIEFDATDLGESESRAVACPHCQTETLVSVRTPPVPPILTSAEQTKTVKGAILDFTVQTSTGIISGDDGKRYSFQGSEWKEVGTFPAKGLRVEFLPKVGNALAVYEVGGLEGSITHTTSRRRPLEYQAYYRSSDEKTFGGVCGGLAHKLGVSKGGLQVAFVLLGLLWLVGLVVYFICWVVFKPLPTKGVKFSD